MKLFLDDQPFDPSRVTYREMGSGGIPESLLHRANIILERREFVELVSELYSTLHHELKDDEERHHDSDQEELAVVTHARVEDLLTHAAWALPRLIPYFLWDPIRAGLFDESPLDRCDYVLDEVLAVVVGSDEITMTLTAFPMRRPTGPARRATGAC